MRSESDRETVKDPAPAPKKDRHIVSWTPEEDELLQEQVCAKGTDNWTSIAAKFKDKTSRQCRRRWCTYLNSEGKKGSWSEEEDMILCEAQKIFGNRWTEIAKVVSGRTDNAVKNRFTTLRKKRAKIESSTKENDSWVNSNNKKVTIQNDFRYQILDPTESHNPVTGEVQLRSPLSVLPQNINSVSGLLLPYCPDNNAKSAAHDVRTGSDHKTEGSFLRKDDPKLTALLQQAELLTSLALKVNSENTSQNLESAWKELQDYLIQTGYRSITPRTLDMDFFLDDFKDLIEDLKSENTGNNLSWRRPGSHEESQESSECSTGSTNVFQVHTSSSSQAVSSQNATDTWHQEDTLGLSMCNSQVIWASSSLEEAKGNVRDSCTITSSEFDSPHQTPSFKSLTEGIPTPMFSASERRFLVGVLGISSPAPGPSTSQPPSCKRILLDSL
ncbi:uncharacterized protein A4U43_C03F17130 [Asparagus officinalis]|uniref:Uncharacterized protein n=1 Tax=Asparagus officinalis TaxID=4686 RepID=A0A5P1FAQ2_ASPOF|nr:transcription factor MYB124 [Asparagus officinalis]ONK75466.1 uncharacterized protein A4U43_C03F17130 [Asparagus officinalis]